MRHRVMLTLIWLSVRDWLPLSLRRRIAHLNFSLLNRGWWAE